jgi:hypothetical protein
MNLTKDNFQRVVESLGYKVVPEYQFIKERKFRADWFVIAGKKKVLVEYEGIVSYKSRHTTVKGYTRDCEKYNLAQVNGYVTLRYTAFNFQDVLKDLDKLEGLL